MLFERAAIDRRAAQHRRHLHVRRACDAYAAGAPTTFTRNVGDPRVAISQVQPGSTCRTTSARGKELTVSAGVRQEYQSHIGGLHLGPRGGIAWSPFKSGKTTIRGGGGIFFDWFDAQKYEQAIQLDGTHQQIETIVQPGFPDAALGGTRDRAAERPRADRADLEQPRLPKPTSGSSRQLPGGVRAERDVHPAARLHVLRGVNLNAPRADGLRPDPTAGTITDIQSTARSSVRRAEHQPQLHAAAAADVRRRQLPARRGRSTRPRPVQPAGRRLQPRRRARAGAVRRAAPVDGLRQLAAVQALPLGTSFRVQSALPYNITTGRDDNGDTISNDRPAGVTRNSGRGRAHVDLGTASRLAHRVRRAGGAGRRPADPHRARRQRPNPGRHGGRRRPKKRTPSSSTRRRSTC